MIIFFNDADTIYNNFEVTGSSFTALPTHLGGILVSERPRTDPAHISGNSERIFMILRSFSWLLIIPTLFIIIWKQSVVV